MNSSKPDQELNGQALLEEQMAADPIMQFFKWIETARNEGELFPNAMTLATCSKEGIPSARIVFLKGIYENCFHFYTNYESKKGEELNQNPHAALVFWWPLLARQVRVEGTVKKLDSEQSTNYFLKRPKESQWASWASPQSKVVSRQYLIDRFEKIKNLASKGQAYQYRPPFWGGYALHPERIEFWQGRPHRLHDRICYQRNQDNVWFIERLAP